VATSSDGSALHRRQAATQQAFFHSSDMLFTKRSQNGAQIKQTKGFDPTQKARHCAGFLLPAKLWLKSAAFSQ
jgi:hypothetical protein